MKISTKLLLDFHFHGDIGAAADYFHVSLSTVYRWIQTDKLPAWAFDWLKIRTKASLRAYGENWDGWRIDSTGITTPDGLFLTREQLIYFSYTVMFNQETHPQARNFMKNKKFDSR